MQTRIKWIDIAKGITIILVILGHSLGQTKSGELLRGMIFSFHMPLFFIMSSLTSRKSVSNYEFIQRTLTSFKRLVIPACILFTISMLVSLCINGCPSDFVVYLKAKVLSLLFASGVTVNMFGTIIEPVGIIWFLFVLFIAKTIYDYINITFSESLFPYVLVFLSVIGVYCGYRVWLPFSLDIACAVLPFLFFGDTLKSMNLVSSSKKLTYWAIVVWVVSFFIMYCCRGSYLEIAKRHYTLFPVCFICAVAGVMVISRLSISAERHERISALLQFLGRNTMAILIVHCMDEYFSFIWELTQNEFVNGINRIVVDVTIVWLFVTVQSKFNKSVE